jgi:hypothetical protein
LVTGRRISTRRGEGKVDEEYEMEKMAQKGHEKHRKIRV